MLQVAAILLAADTHQTPSKLEGLLSTLCGDHAGYARLFRGKAVKRRDFERWLKANGVRAWCDEEKSVQHFGLAVRGYPASMIEVAGKSHSLLVLVENVDKESSWLTGHPSLVLFTLQPNGVQADVIRKYSELSESLNPDDALWSQGRLYLAGTRYWFGNAPREAAGVYSRDGALWQGSEITADFESWGASPLQPRADGAVAPIRVCSRTWPKNLAASHSTAHLTFEEEWRFDHGRPVFAWRRMRSTAYNVLDKMYPAIARGHAAEIRKFCLTDRVARRAAALSATASRSEPQVLFPGPVNDAASKVVGLSNLRSWFFFTSKNGRYLLSSISPMKWGEY